MTAALLVLASCVAPGPEPLVVLAPDHSRSALQRVAWEWGERTQVPVQVVYASSAEIERLVDTGAAADVVLAPTPVLEVLESRRHLAEDSRRVVSGDHQLVARLAARDAPPLSRPSDLVAPGAGALVVAAADAPLGAATVRRLRLSGAWADPAPTRLERPDGARVARALHDRAATWGVLEGSRAATDPDLQTVLVLTEGAGAAAIVYEAATTAHARSPAGAAALVAHLTEPSTGAAFVRVGWVPRQRAAGAAPTPGSGAPPQPAAK